MNPWHLQSQRARIIMAGDPIPPLSPDAELDKFLRALSRGHTQATATPAPDDGQPVAASQLSNVHQGNVQAEEIAAGAAGIARLPQPDEQAAEAGPDDAASDEAGAFALAGLPIPPAAEAEATASEQHSRAAFRIAPEPPAAATPRAPAGGRTGSGTMLPAGDGANAQAVSLAEAPASGETALGASANPQAQPWAVARPEGPTAINDAPVNITVAGGSVLENAAIGTVVAELEAIDPDAGETFTYTLDQPSALFEIVGKQLVVKAGADVDHETAASHQLSVTVTDSGGLTHSRTVTITVTDQNEAPTDLSLNGGNFAENVSAGAAVSQLGAADADGGETFTYTLDQPSALFEIVGDRIVVKAGADIDYEAATSHQLSVTVTDAGGLTHTETVTITIGDENEAPTDLTVAGGAVQENAAAGTVVAQLGAADPDAGDNSFTYALAAPSALFEIVGDRIVVKAGATMDHETAASHELSVIVTDAEGLSYAETVTIAIGNQNEAPTAITVGGGSVAENAAAGTVVAQLGAADPDAGETFSYSLDQPSSLFEITGDKIVVKAGSGIDYEAAASHQLSVTVTDSGGDSHSETITIGVTDRNEAPTGMGVTGGSVQENAAAGTVVAQLGAADADAGDSFIYALASPSSLFEIVGNQVKVKAGANLDYETAASHEIAVTVTDAGGLSRTETVEIQLTNQSGTINGTAANDILTGTSEEDIIQGLAGDDTIDGGLGNDIMIGGLGNDIYTVDAAGDAVTELAGQGTDRVNSHISYTLGADIENLTLYGVGNIDGTGNALANTINGNNGNNVLSGGDGDDTLTAAGGNDTLIGGAGNDTLSGGTGNDAMTGGLGNDTYVIDASGDTVTELLGEGTDLVQSAISHTLGDNVENLTLTGSAAISGTGNALANSITGNTGSNVLSGGDGNDTLNGGTGSDTMIGGAGNDIYYVDNAGDVITELAGGGADTVNSSISHMLAAEVENLTLTGSAAITGSGNALANSITGNTGANILSGGDGNDTLNGGTGSDTMIGGAGNDIYYVDNAADIVTELAGGGTDTVNSSITHTLSADVENLTLSGSAAINGAGNALANTITGNTGVNVLDGGDGNDSLSGGTGNDTLIGGAGDDTLNGGSGNDAMQGGDGNDIYAVDASGDVVTELAGQGIDTVQSSISYTLGATLEHLTLTGSSSINGTGNALDNVITGNTGTNVLNGGGGNDRLIGGSGNDTLSGGTGDDRLEGGTGNDTMQGGDGNDTYVVDVTSDIVTETAGEGIDAVESSSSYTLVANVENLTLTGSGAINGVGNALDNVITGNSGNNALSGGDGNDTLIGGAGNDTMNGGLGDDIFVVDSAGDVVTESAGQGTDTVQSSVSHTLGANVENLTLTGAAAVNGAGNTLANVLLGNDAANTLSGGAGDDTLTGGYGNDTLHGGDGHDLFAYMKGQGSDIMNGGAGGGWADTIGLSQDGGALQFGADWTVSFSSGGIDSQAADTLLLTADAAGTVTFTDGSTLQFTGMEQIKW
jgi:Ca2+-binding RTX toxin-like protein